MPLLTSNAYTGTASKIADKYWFDRVQTGLTIKNNDTVNKITVYVADDEKTLAPQETFVFDEEFEYFHVKTKRGTASFTATASGPLTSQKADYAKKKASIGMSILKQKLENKVSDYIAKNGYYLYIDRVITNFSNNLVEDFEVKGMSLYKSTTNVYSHVWSASATIESLQNFNITIKQGSSTTLATVAVALSSGLNGIEYRKGTNDVSGTLAAYDVLSKNKIIRNVGKAVLNGSYTIKDSDILVSDGTRIIIRIDGSDTFDMQKAIWMVSGLPRLWPDDVFDGVGYSNNYKCMVLQLSATTLTAYAGATLKEKTQAYLAANTITALWAKQIPTYEDVTITFNGCRVTGDLDITTDATTFNPVISAKVACTRDQIKDYVFNRNGVKYNGQLKRYTNSFGLPYLGNSKGKPIQLKGIGTHHLFQYTSIQNAAGMETLKYYGVNIVRLTAYLSDKRFAKSNNEVGIGYLNSVAETRARMDELIAIAKSLDMYVIVDWHYMDWDGLLTVTQTQAVEFFTYFTNKYPADPYIVYELINEPYGHNSEEVTEHVNQTLPIIIAKSPNALIISGHGNGSYSWLYNAINALGTTFQNANLFLSAHYYVGANTNNGSATALALMINAGVPIVVSEWGISEGSGDGIYNLTWAQNLVDLMEKENISWCCWKWTYQDMTTSLLVNSTAVENGSATYGGWLEGDLSVNGNFMINAWNTPANKI